MPLLMERLKQIKEKYETKLLALPYVVGVGIGIKQRKGQSTKRFCLKVYVRKKSLKNSLREEEIVPKKLEGIETDVEEIGRVKIL
jgi:hypothetical protein